MQMLNRNDKIRLYKPLTHFLSLIDKKTEKNIENSYYVDLIIFPPHHAKKKIKISEDITDEFVIIALTAKRMVETYEYDARDVLFGLGKLTSIILNKLQSIDPVLYSKLDKEEIKAFIKTFKNSIPNYHPRYDDEMLMLFKIEYLVNSLLYFANSMNERRFPYGSDYYEFLYFILNEGYIFLKPKLEEGKKYIKKVITNLQLFLNYTTIVYMLEHQPDIVPIIVFFLINAEKCNINEDEKELIKELLSATILVTQEAKEQLFSKF